MDAYEELAMACRLAEAIRINRHRLRPEDVSKEDTAYSAVTESALRVQQCIKPNGKLSLIGFFRMAKLRAESETYFNRYRYALNP